MSRIRSKDTKPEMIVRRHLHSLGFRYRLHVKTMPGKPDIVLPKYKTIIFVHGCFFHGHIGCKFFKFPKTRELWWRDKIEKNTVNDVKNFRGLSDLNWNVITIWECELKKDRIKETMDNLLDQLEKYNEHKT